MNKLIIQLLTACFKWSQEGNLILMLYNDDEISYTFWLLFQLQAKTMEIN